jgi:dihydrofolate synthase/folylpolyglutamate synthase
LDFTSFDEVVSYMESFTNLEKQVDHYTVRTYRLDRMRALMDHFGPPSALSETAHRGSKGKGSRRVIWPVDWWRLAIAPDCISPSSV